MGKILNIADRNTPPIKISWDIMIDEDRELMIGFRKINSNAFICISVPNWEQLEPAKQEALRELKKHGIAELDQTSIKHPPYILGKEGKTIL